MPEDADKNDEDNEPLAAWEALLFPTWRWEALEKKDDGLYYGRVKSSLTYDRWEYGYFTSEQLEEAKAYRVDTNIDEEEPLFPDGGRYELTDVYETELEALNERYLEDLDEGDLTDY